MPALGESSVSHEHATGSLCHHRAMLKPAPGHLLIASPLLEDPNFDRTVVLIGDHGPDGTFGVVLNRPLGIETGDDLPAWTPLLGPPATLFGGGPVAPETVLGLALGGGGEAPIDSELRLVNLAEPPPPDVGQVRLFAGHAGWGGGQLAGELAAEAWFVVHRAPGDVFTSEPEMLWRNVLRRQPGELQLLSFYPRDLSAN